MARITREKLNETNNCEVKLNRAVIEELLTKYDLSQKRLADMTSMTESAISRYMSGSRTPGIKNLAKIAWALNVNIDDIIINRGRTEDDIT